MLHAGGAVPHRQRPSGVSIALAATISQLIQFGFAAAQAGVSVVRRVAHQRVWDDEPSCCKEGRCGEKHGCSAVHCYDCIECRPRVYPRGCCQ